MRNQILTSRTRSSAITHVVVVVAIGGVLLLYYALFFRPLAIARETDSRRAAQLERLLRSANSVGRQHRELSNSLTDLQQGAQDVRDRIPDEPLEAVFLRDITEIAQEVGLNIVDYRRGTTSRTPTHSQVEIGLKCRGSYTSICGFLDRIAGLPRLSRVQKMTVHAKNGADLYPFDITLLLLYGLIQVDSGKGSAGI